MKSEKGVYGPYNRKHNVLLHTPPIPQLSTGTLRPLRRARGGKELHELQAIKEPPTSAVALTN